MAGHSKLQTRLTIAAINQKLNTQNHRLAGLQRLQGLAKRETSGEHIINDQDAFACLQDKATAQFASPTCCRLCDHTAHPQLASQFLSQEPAACGWTNHDSHGLIAIPLCYPGTELLGHLRMLKNTKLFPVLIAMPSGTEQEMSMCADTKIVTELQQCG
jgi:hypothetical protein